MFQHILILQTCLFTKYLELANQALPGKGPCFIVGFGQKAQIPRSIPIFDFLRDTILPSPMYSSPESKMSYSIGRPLNLLTGIPLFGWDCPELCEDWMTLTNCEYRLAATKFDLFGAR